MRGRCHQRKEVHTACWDVTRSLLSLSSRVCLETSIDPWARVVSNFYCRSSSVVRMCGVTSSPHDVSTYTTTAGYAQCLYSVWRLNDSDEIADLFVNYS